MRSVPNCDSATDNTAIPFLQSSSTMNRVTAHAQKTREGPLEVEHGRQLRINWAHGQLPDWKVSGRGHAATLKRCAGPRRPPVAQAAWHTQLLETVILGTLMDV